MFKKNLSKKNLKPLSNNELKTSIARKFYIVLLVMAIFFGLIIYNLFDIAIAKQAYYTTKLEAYTRRLQTITTPRGTITDRNGTVLVGNQLVLNIVYFPNRNITDQQEWELAEKFSQSFAIDESTLNLSDRRDAYIFLYPKQAQALMSEEEITAYRQNKMTASEYHRLMSSRITEDILSVLTPQQLRSYAVYQAMNLPSAGQPNIIKSNVSHEEIAYLLEHSAEFPGFYDTTDWQRTYPNGHGLRGVLGTVSNSKQGLPTELLQSYLALDYARNEKVGRSGLELQYENLLSGERIVRNINYNEQGTMNAEIVEEGSKGNDLRLAIDFDLQQKVEEIAISILEQHKNDPNRKFFDNIQFVILDPNNGDTLALVSIKRQADGSYLNDGALTYLSAFSPGSAIKGSVVYMGLKEGYVKPGEVIPDTPIKVAGTPLKSSSRPLSNIYDLRALSESSNVFMMHVVMRMAGVQYVPDVVLRGVDSTHFAKMRNYFSMFGLGTKTGIDIPNETIGYVGSSVVPGLLLDFSIGQYDTYTPLQMAQYVATIANDGKRMRPRLVIEATQTDSQNVVYDHQPEIISVLDDPLALSRVQQGFRLCVTEGLCRAYLSDASVPIAAKTGTAENTITVDGVQYQSPNNSLVAYAPYDNPKIALSCVMENAWSSNVTQVNLCQEMTRQVTDYYFSR